MPEPVIGIGNQVFKEAGASIVSHSDVPRLMERYIDKELARRQRFFTNSQYKDWRSNQLAPAHLEALHHLLTTGKSMYLDRE